MTMNNVNLEGEYIEKYMKLKDEFETYQNFAEGTIEMLKQENTKLEKKLDAITNIVEISKYINSYLSNQNLIPMINDMIIGILGATYSSIYILEDDELKIKATNVKNVEYKTHSKEYCDELLNGHHFIINSKICLFNQSYRKREIHSVVGVPIYLRDKFIGYIIVEHALNNFFGHDHVKFISTIANQIAIALENNALYNQIRDLAIRDPLLGIYNRKHFFNTLYKKVSENENQKFAIVMLDLDDFKKANDEYGHQFGDMILKYISKLILSNLEKDDLFARYGGEEFIICINEFNTREEVYNKIDNIRKTISNKVINYENMRYTMTVSFGVSYYPLDNLDLHEVISVADSRLYVAKETGKNKVIYK